MKCKEFLFQISVFNIENSNDSEVEILPTFLPPCYKLNFVAIVGVCHLVIGGAIVDV